MMSASLRSRLWWSYVLVTAAALGVVAIVLFIYIVQNPSTYRQAYARLTIVATLLSKNQTNLSSAGAAELKTQLRQVDNTYGARIVVYNQRRQLVVDSRADTHAPIRMPLFPRLKPTGVVRDENRGAWLYSVELLKNGRWLLVAVPRPAVPFLKILSDELVVPILGAAIVALIVSLLVAFWLARWIGGPLQRVVVASRNMPSTRIRPIQTDGPQEVQELSRAFNEMNARVVSTQESHREFVANVSHELKTPITSIQGFAQAILDGTADTPDSRQQAAKVIYEEAGRMHRMVLDLLELARLDAGTLDLQFTPVDIPALLHNIAEKFAPQSQAAGVTIRVEAEALPAVMVDGDRLAQVFSNLVDNALKNTAAEGQISLTATQVDSDIQVEVTDTGCGIPPEALPHIFERFYQADPARSGGKKHGSGLGLAIAREIINAHGGKIGVRSTQQPDLNGAGVPGSTFTVRIPLSTTEVNASVSKRKKQ